MSDISKTRNKQILKKYDPKSIDEVINRVTVTYGLANILEDGSISSEVTWNQDFNKIIKNKWLNKEYSKGREYFILQKISTVKIEPIFKLKVK